MFSRRRARHMRGMTDVSSPSMSIPDVTADATARYENNSHSGATWNDLTPLPANGTDGGTPGFWPNFDGVSWVTLDASIPNKLNFAGAYTIQTWAQQSPDVPVQGNERIISRDPNGGIRSYLIMNSDNNGQVTYYSWDGATANNAQTGAAPAMGVWYHFAAVNEGPGGDLIIYRNGLVSGTGVGKGGVPNYDATTPVEFGRIQSGSPDDYWTGQIDTGRFYNRALSADEILRDYNAGISAHS